MKRKSKGPRQARKPPVRTRVNNLIRVPEIRVVDEDGNHLNVMDRDVALRMAQERGLDLVEISPEAEPPVCKIMDFGKFKYEKKKRDHESKLKQKVILIKEIKLRVKTGEHDREIKLKRAAAFLEGGDKVKVSLRFYGREMAHQDLGFKALSACAKYLDELATIEKPAGMEGRSVTMILVPIPASKRKKAGEEAQEEGSGEENSTERADQD